VESSGDYRDLIAIAEGVRERYGDQVKSHLVLSRGDDFAAPPGLNVIKDPGGVAHRAFGAGARCFYLIRPDFYVGFRALPPDGSGLLKNLGLIFK